MFLDFNEVIFKDRRKKVVANMLTNSALILHSGFLKRRTLTVNYPFRVDSNFYYLSGFDEPNSVLVVSSNNDIGEVIFIADKNPEKERWEGEIHGINLVQEKYKFTATYSIDSFENTIVSLLKNIDYIYYDFFQDNKFDSIIVNIINQIKKNKSRNEKNNPTIIDPDDIISELRIIKDVEEKNLIEQACQVSCRAHLEAMKKTKPGLNERQIQAILQYSMLYQEASGESYPSIVASGNNANVLHYRNNSSKLMDNDLLLVDAGCEYQYYASDITRTFPIGGRFLPAQKVLYKNILNIQKSIIEFIKPGVSFEFLQNKAIDMLVELMMELGFFTGRKEDVLNTGEYKKYYPHSIGHWMGLSAHDVGSYNKNGKSRLFEQGMCLTIEPGIYISKDDSNVPKEFRGIGIRIEDNILITKSSCEIVTKSLPKEIEDLEGIVGSGT